MADKDKKSSNTDEQILNVARERYELCKEAYYDIHKEGREDDSFRFGDQWPENVRRDREIEQRPCLTVNRLPQFIRQVTNDQKQNDPTATFTPVDDFGDVDTAKIYTGIYRNIDRNSNGTLARDWAFDGAAGRGFGYFRIVTDYVSPTSFLQEIRYKKVLDAYSVMLDPSHSEIDGSDANYAFVGTRMQKDEFIQAYGESKLAQKGEWEVCGELLPSWVDEDSVLVMEYFYKDFKSEKLLLLSTGESYTESQLKNRFENGLIAEGTEIVDERETVTAIVKWIKFAGTEIIERTDWPSQYIPIIPVYGELQIVDGKKVFKSVIRDAKDPQRMLNYWVSAETETIALAPRAPWIGYAGQFEGFEDKWQTANSRSHAFLEVNPTMVNGQPAPLPQRNAFEPPVQAITNARVQAEGDLKGTTGIYDAALGQRSNENSGIAIQRRANQAQTSNYHFTDNLAASIRHAGRIICELIPVIYDSARAQQILGEDGESEIVKINQEFEDNGKLRTYDLSRGKYDISIDMGPSYAAKRQEAVASMVEVVKMNPSLFGIMGDLLVKNMDWPGAQEIAERVKKTIPPHLIGDNNGDVPPQVQAQMAQMNQAIQVLTAQLQDAQSKMQNKSMELESKERIEFSKMDVDLKKELLKASAPMSQAIVQAEIANINRREEILGINQPFPNPNLNGAGLQPAAPPIQQQPTGGQPGTYVGN